MTETRRRYVVQIDLEWTPAAEIRDNPAEVVGRAREVLAAAILEHMARIGALVTQLHIEVGGTCCIRLRISIADEAVTTLMLTDIAKADAQGRLEGGDLIDAGQAVLRLSEAERLRSVIHWVTSERADSMPAGFAIVRLSTGVDG